MQEKHSVLLYGHRTSLTLEPEFWHVLKEIASEQDTSLTAIIKQIDANRTENLSSAVRLFILKTLLEKINQ